MVWLREGQRASLSHKSYQAWAITSYRHFNHHIHLKIWSEVCDYLVDSSGHLREQVGVGDAALLQDPSDHLQVLELLPVDSWSSCTWIRPKCWRSSLLDLPVPTGTCSTVITSCIIIIFTSRLSPGIFAPVTLTAIPSRLIIRAFAAGCSGLRWFNNLNEKKILKIVAKNPNPFWW